MELEDIEIGEVNWAQQRAVMRLHVFFTGETHRLLAEYARRMRSRLEAFAGEDGTITTQFSPALMDYAEVQWRQSFRAWRAMFEAARREAATIPWGALGRYHLHFMGMVEVEEALPPSNSPLQGGRVFQEQGEVQVGVRAVPFFEQQVQAVLDAANERIYGDGFKLSQRIWRLDQESLGGIQRILQETMAEGNSAWNAAKQLEAYLGAGADCPRWTRTRLYKLTKQDIAEGDETGLIRGNPCESKGVAYNALRLARNEIQIAHHAATDALFASQPWIEMEQITLSPDHPDIGCACEDIVIGGENGDGVYPKGEVQLPIHVQCLCFKVGVLMPADEFTGRLRDWMGGDMPWPEMDEYANGLLGLSKAESTAVQLALPLAESLLRWMGGKESELKGALGVATDESPYR